MPIKLSDIEVEITTIESDYEPNKYECSICKQKVEVDKGAVLHRLDYCLAAIVRTIDFLTEEFLKYKE